MDRNFRSVNVICFPYAGGSKNSYNSLKTFLQKEINIVPVELPGRRERLTEPLLDDINLMTDDLFRQIEEHVHVPYVKYGHNIGGLLGYSVTRKIHDKNLTLPLGLVISGCKGSSLKNGPIKLRSQLPHDKFEEELKTMGGLLDFYSLTPENKSSIIPYGITFRHLEPFECLDGRRLSIIGRVVN